MQFVPQSSGPGITMTSSRHFYPSPKCSISRPDPDIDKYYNLNIVFIGIAYRHKLGGIPLKAGVWLFCGKKRFPAILSKMTTSKKSGILLFTFFALLLIFNDYVSARTSQEPPLTPEQIEAFRSAKTVRLRINQSYGSAEGVSLPFERFLRKILKNYAQCEVVGLDAPEYDLTIKINVNGRALSRIYQGYRHFGANLIRGSWTLFTGAALSGTIELESEGLPSYTKKFTGKHDPPRIISEYSIGADGKNPSKAPFMKLNPYFLSALFEMLGEIYGVDLIIAAHQGRISTFNFTENFRESALLALTNLGDRAVVPLIAALNQDDSHVRIFAAEALGKLKDPRAVDPLVRLLEDKNVDVRILVAEVLGEIGDPRACGFLISSLGEKNTDVKVKIIETLGKIKDPRSVTPLIETLEDKNNKVRQAAAYALGQIKDPRAVKSLIVHLGTKSRGFREAVVSALGEYEDTRTIDLLVAAMNNNNGKSIREVNRRLCAAWALGRIDDPVVVEPLINQLNNEKSKAIRISLVQNALGIMTAPQAIELMISSLKDNNIDKQNKGFIVAALRQITNHRVGYTSAEWEAWWAENKDIFAEKPEEETKGIIRK